jgi:hypothetical protein
VRLFRSQKNPLLGSLLGNAARRVPLQPRGFPRRSLRRRWGLRNNVIGVGVTAIANTGDVGISTRNSGLVKRALFGLVLLVTLVAGSACLLHATIEADGDPTGRSYSDEAGNGGVETAS